VKAARILPEPLTTGFRQRNAANKPNRIEGNRVMRPPRLDAMFPGLDLGPQR